MVGYKRKCISFLNLCKMEGRLEPGLAGTGTWPLKRLATRVHEESWVGRLPLLEFPRPAEKTSLGCGLFSPGEGRAHSRFISIRLISRDKVTSVKGIRILYPRTGRWILGGPK